MTNRQPAGTIGATAAHKGGTFTTKTAGESNLDVSTPPEYKSLGLTGTLETGTGKDSEFLMGVSSVFTTAGGRRIALGFDEQGDPGASIKVPGYGMGLAEDEFSPEIPGEMYFSSETVNRASCARYALRNVIALESAKKVFNEKDVDVNYVSVGDGENPEVMEFEMTIADKTYYLLQSTADGATTLGRYNNHGSFEDVEGEDLNQVMQDTTDLPVGRNGDEMLHDRGVQLAAAMLSDVDTDAGMKEALWSSRGGAPAAR